MLWLVKSSQDKSRFPWNKPLISLEKWPHAPPKSNTAPKNKEPRFDQWKRLQSATVLQFCEISMKSKCSSFTVANIELNLRRLDGLTQQWMMAGCQRHVFTFPNWGYSFGGRHTGNIALLDWYTIQTHVLKTHIFFILTRIWQTWDVWIWMTMDLLQFQTSRLLWWS